MTAATTPTAVTAGAHALRPLGPFDLERTRHFVGRWDPITRHTPGPDEPLRLTAPLDGDQRPVAFALRQDGPDAEVHVEIAGADGAEEVALAQIARACSRWTTTPATTRRSAGASRPSAP